MRFSLHRPLCLFTLALLPLAAQAEATLTATIIQADFSNAPEARLLVRVMDEAFGSQDSSIAERSYCASHGEAADRPGPDTCFSITLDEGAGPQPLIAQTLLNEPQRGSDPVYVEVLYRSHYPVDESGSASRPLASVRVEANGFYNWNDEQQQSLPQNYKVVDKGFYPLVLNDADALLNSTYRERLGRLPEARQAALREAQRKWMVFRDAECKPAGGGAHSAFGEQEHNCLLRLTLDRARQIATAPVMR